MKNAIFIFIVLYCVWQIKCSESEATVTEQDVEQGARNDQELLYAPPLVSPYGGNLKLLFGVSIPIALTGGTTLVFGQNFQFQYPMPQNASLFAHFYDDVKRRARWRRSGTRKRWTRILTDTPDHTRSKFYEALEQTFDVWGANGKDCLRKSICEIAGNPLQDEGLVGELLHVMLTPDYGTKQGFTIPDDDDVYLRAARTGRCGDDCSLIYPNCPKGGGLLDRVSELDYMYS